MAVITECFHSSWTWKLYNSNLYLTYLEQVAYVKGNYFYSDFGNDAEKKKC